MESVDDFLMFVAIDESGRPCPGISTAILSRACVEGLVGPHQDVAGAVLDPGDVLAALDGFVPADRESRNEYSAILVLALIAEVRGVRLGCDGEDPRAWTPERDPDFLSADVQAALALIARQLRCTADYAAHRLFAVVEEAGVPLQETSRDVVAGRLSFVGSPTGPTVSIWARESSDQ